VHSLGEFTPLEQHQFQSEDVGTLLKFPRETMFDIVDLGGNAVGGSSFTGVWVQK
jgi:hypothetical protein